jgi:hypothetical protein
MRGQSEEKDKQRKGLSLVKGMSRDTFRPELRYSLGGDNTVRVQRERWISYKNEEPPVPVGCPKGNIVPLQLFVNIPSVAIENSITIQLQHGSQY